MLNHNLLVPKRVSLPRPSRPGPVPRRGRLLVVNGDGVAPRSLVEILARRYAVDGAASAGEATRAARRGGHDLVVLEAVAPGEQALSLVQHLGSPGDERLPVMLVSGEAPPEARARSFAAGVIDLVARPFHPDELYARVERVIATRAREAALRHEAGTDPLTGLANRRALYHHLREVVERVRRSGAPLAVVAVDLDDFKAINEALGHVAADRALSEVAAALRASARRTDLVARYGGDEFVVVCSGIGEDRAGAAAERMRLSIEERLDYCGLTASVGVATVPLEPPPNPDVCMARVDRALSAAKRAGKNRVHVAASPASPAAGPGARARRLLLACGDHDLATLLSRFARHGCSMEVEVARDARELSRRCAGAHPDVVLLDADTIDAGEAAPLAATTRVVVLSSGPPRELRAATARFARAVGRSKPLDFARLRADLEAGSAGGE